MILSSLCSSSSSSSASGLVVTVVPVGEDGADAKIVSPSEPALEGGAWGGGALTGWVETGGPRAATATSQLGGGERSLSGGRAGGTSGTGFKEDKPAAANEGGCLILDGLGYGKGGGASSESGTSVAVSHIRSTVYTPSHRFTRRMLAPLPRALREPSSRVAGGGSLVRPDSGPPSSSTLVDTCGRTILRFRRGLGSSAAFALGEDVDCNGSERAEELALGLRA